MLKYEGPDFYVSISLLFPFQYKPLQLCWIRIGYMLNFFKNLFAFQDMPDHLLKDRVGIQPFEVVTIVCALR